MDVSKDSFDSLTIVESDLYDKSQFTNAWWSFQINSDNNKKKIYNVTMKKIFIL